MVRTRSAAQNAVGEREEGEVTESDNEVEAEEGQRVYREGEVTGADDYPYYYYGDEEEGVDAVVDHVDDVEEDALQQEIRRVRDDGGGNVSPRGDDVVRDPSLPASAASVPWVNQHELAEGGGAVPNNVGILQEQLAAVLTQLRGVREQQQVHRMSIARAERARRESEAEVRALRSQMKAVASKKQLASTVVAPPAKKHSKQPLPKTTNKRVAGVTSSTLPPPSRKKTRNTGMTAALSPTVANQLVSNHPGNNDSSFSFGVLSDGLGGVAAGGDVVCRIGLFKPPHISKEHLTTIQKGDFMCFDKLKPKKVNHRSLEDARGIDRFQMDFDEVTGQIGLKKSKTNWVHSFVEWIQVWNIFMQARLSVAPSEFAKLFAYQKQMSVVCRRYKFEAAYSYDKDFRQAIASERSLPPGLCKDWDSPLDDGD